MYERYDPGKAREKVYRRLSFKYFGFLIYNIFNGKCYFM